MIGDSYGARDSGWGGGSSYGGGGSYDSWGHVTYGKLSKYNFFLI